jgi:hypothetical protein
MNIERRTFNFERPTSNGLCFVRRSEVRRWTFEVQSIEPSASNIERRAAGMLQMLHARLCHMADAHRATTYNNQTSVTNARVTPRKGVTPSDPRGHSISMGTPRPPRVRLGNSHRYSVSSNACLSLPEENAKTVQMVHRP